MLRSQPLEQDRHHALAQVGRRAPHRLGLRARDHAHRGHELQGCEVVPHEPLPLRRGEQAPDAVERAVLRLAHVARERVARVVGERRGERAELQADEPPHVVVPGVLRGVRERLRRLVGHGVHLVEDRERHRVEQRGSGVEVAVERADPDPRRVGDGVERHVAPPCGDQGPRRLHDRRPAP
nr:hypothetical protein [Cellulosimicrobium composti]